MNRVAQASRLRVRAPSRCPFPELAARCRQNPQPRRLRYRHAGSWSVSKSARIWKLSLNLRSWSQRVSWAVALTLWFTIQPLLGAQVIWSGADASTNANWSDTNNWTGGTPALAANIYFFDQGSNGVQGVVNNLVNSNTAISSLQYGNTNGFHTTQINTGVTLTVTNKAVGALVFAGTGVTTAGVGVVPSLIFK